MATEAPSWADQWGAGGIGAMENEDRTKVENESSNKKANAKGFNKAKVAFFSAIKWVKHRCQRKSTDK
ncbi:hypothetical protein WN944_012563 [Citrus x changshan-huyou]|uniref:Uncharacterized protein n=3 Tax=Citrus TaxID=2706 RepID=A0A067GHW4_CITSI|nr:hypothetical protein CICLE_v10018055mg [Citrus x clementina]KDO78245.1 hypothetical protein CISIN_1g035318mg [Citrus sinensis]GAY35196.1 hypothetical protein CUMW_014890 [Citrus unshiu]